MPVYFFSKEFLGFLSVALTFACYLPYFWFVAKGRVTPHVFSWVIWGIGNAVIFAGQHVEGAGAGSWVAGVTAILCFIIVGISFFRGEKHITRSDWIAFIAALSTIPVWCMTRDPLWAIVLATAIDVIGTYPTVRKAFHKPYTESVFTWSMASLRSFVSYFAIAHYSPATIIYPVAMTLANGGVAIYLAWRRYQLRINAIPAYA